MPAEQNWGLCLQKPPETKLGIASLYFREDEEQELMQNVYIEVKVREEPYLGQYRGLSIGFQDLAGWVRYIQE